MMIPRSPNWWDQHKDWKDTLIEKYAGSLKVADQKIQAYHSQTQFAMNCIREVRTLICDGSCKEDLLRRIDQTLDMIVEDR